MYNFKGKEQTKTLEQLIFIYENQILNVGDPSYINALAELIKQRYSDQGISDFDPTEPIDGEDDRNIGSAYELFEQKVIAVIDCYNKGEKWVVKKGTIKAYKN